MTRYARALVGVLLVAGAGCADGTGPGTDGPFGSDTAPDIDRLLAPLDLETGLARITAQDMAQRIEVLAHDSMEGRLTGTRELEVAAAYIATELAAAGLEPAGTDPGSGVSSAEGYYARWDLPPAFTTEWVDTLAAHPPNVAALLPGSDPGLADSYVVVTAHFDHVGIGPADDNGDSIFNGADDNASGTAVLLEVAEALAALPTAPRRSILFLAVSGEELGLLGSQLYLVSPTIPASRMVANINLDMVSRGPANEAWVVGYGLSTLGLLAQAVSDQVPELEIEAVSDEYLSTDLISRSDHFAFALRHIPAVGVFGGFHPDYHTPDDEADRIDASKAARVARMATYLAATVATLDDAPHWTALGEAVMSPWW
jgi:hypothetical protein